MITMQMVISGATPENDTVRVSVAEEGTVIFQVANEPVALLLFDKHDWLRIVEFVREQSREPTMGGRE